MRSAAVDRRLEAIAGSPLAMLTAPGLQQIPPREVDGLTLFLVSEILSNASSGGTTARAGATAGSGFVHNAVSVTAGREIRTQIDSSAAWYARLAGTPILTTQSGRSAGRHVVVVTDNFTTHVSQMHIDGVGIQSVTGTQGSLTVDRVDLGDVNAWDQPLAAVVYPRALNATQRVAVTRWLAQRFSLSLSLSLSLS